MLETKMTISENRSRWTEAGEERLMSGLAALGGRYTYEYAYGRKVMTVTYPRAARTEAERAVKRFLSDIFCRSVKRDYLVSRLKLPMLGENSREILLRTLIAFDRDRDAELVRRKLKLSSEISIDGFYRFRLSELDARWLEIARLTEENVALLYDEGALDLLLKFLLSAVEPRSETVSVSETERGYLLVEPGEPDRLLCRKELIPALVDIAPMEIVLENGITDRALGVRISSIFDVKGANNTLIFGENMR